MKKLLCTALFLFAIVSSAGAATWSVTPAGTDANPCTYALPCKTLNRAYHIAAPGDTVYVSAGSYSGETITADPTKTSLTDVYFHGNGSAVFFTSKVTVYGSHITFRYMNFGVWYAKLGANDLQFYKVNAAMFFVNSASNVLVKGGSVGGTDTGSKSQITYGSKNVTIDGVRFHDVTRPEGSTAHTECLQVGGVDGLVIKNSLFERCYHHDVFIRSWGSSSPLRNITITNNNFGRTLAGFYVGQLYDDLAPQPSGPYTFTNNTCEQSFHFDVIGALTKTGNTGC